MEILQNQVALQTSQKGAKRDSVSLGFNPSITTSFLRHLDDKNSWIFYFLIFFLF